MLGLILTIEINRVTIYFDLMIGVAWRWMQCVSVSIIYLTWVV